MDLTGIVRQLTLLSSQILICLKLFCLETAKLFSCVPPPSLCSYGDDFSCSLRFFGGRGGGGQVEWLFFVSMFRNLTYLFKAAITFHAWCFLKTFKYPFFNIFSSDSAFWYLTKKPSSQLDANLLLQPLCVLSLSL